MSEVDEKRSVLQSNERFYRVFATGNGDEMDALWSSDAHVLCTHPGRAALIGRSAVMQSWRALLEQAPEIVCSDADVAVIRGVAIVTCLEHIGQAVLSATNVFIWEDGDWKLAHHHAGPLAERQEQASPEPGGHLH